MYRVREDPVPTAAVYRKMFVDGSRPVYRVDAVTDDWLDEVRSSHGQHVSINLTSSDWRTSLASMIQLSDDAAADAGDGGGLRLCSGRWRPPQHAVFHVAHALLLVSFLVPITRTSVGFIHLAVVAGKNFRCREHLKSHSGFVLSLF